MVRHIHHSTQRTQVTGSPSRLLWHQSLSVAQLFPRLIEPGWGGNGGIPKYLDYEELKEGEGGGLTGSVLV